MNEITNWIVMDKYPFSLLPGEARSVEGQAESYYEYLNGRSHETGKNVQAMMYALGNLHHGLIIEEPFGGVGVFSVALNYKHLPRQHRILELDAECVTQLQQVLGNSPGVIIRQGDAHHMAGIIAADVYVCDFPFFTMHKFITEELWMKELSRMIFHRPQSIVITDGASSRYHLIWKHLRKHDENIDSTRESYIRAMSRLMNIRYNYSITRCGWHGTCFYYNLVPGDHDPREIQFRNFPSGSGPKGLRRA